MSLPYITTWYPVPPSRTGLIVPILKTYGIKELKEKFILIGLVQNNKMADKFVSDFKKYDTEDDWTYGFNEYEPERLLALHET